MSCHDCHDQDEDDGGTDGMKVSCVALKKRLFSVVTVQHASGDLQDSWSFSNSISIQSLMCKYHFYYFRCVTLNSISNSSLISNS